jgi:hypothetical protein
MRGGAAGPCANAETDHAAAMQVTAAKAAEARVRDMWASLEREAGSERNQALQDSRRSCSPARTSRLLGSLGDRRNSGRACRPPELLFDDRHNS